MKLFNKLLSTTVLSLTLISNQVIAKESFNNFFDTVSDIQYSDDETYTSLEDNNVCFININKNDSDVKNLVNDNDKKNVMDFIINHERRHCDIFNKNKFYYNQFSKETNNIFSMALLSDPNINFLYAENEADAYAAGINMISNYDENLLNNIIQFRENNYNIRNDEYQHYTHYSLKEMLNNRDKVGLMNKVELQNYVSSVASKNVVKILSENKNVYNLSNLLNNQTLLNSITNYMISVASLKQLGKKVVFIENDKNNNILNQVNILLKTSKNMKELKEKTYNIVSKEYKKSLDQFKIDLNMEFFKLKNSDNNLVKKLSF